MRFNDVSTPADRSGAIEFADIRSLLSTRERRQALHLLSLLREGLMAETSPEGDLTPELDEMVEALDRQVSTRSGTGPAMAIVVAGQDLDGEAPRILAYASGEYYPRSRCLLITGLGREPGLPTEVVWQGPHSLTELARDRLLARLESLAGPEGPAGIFMECPDPDAEGLDGAPEVARRRRHRQRRHSTRPRFDLKSLPVDFDLPAWAPERTRLVSCATQSCDHLGDLARLKVFLLELWEWVAGRLPVRLSMPAP